VLTSSEPTLATSRSHVLALGNAHDECDVQQYEYPWPNCSGYPRTQTRPDSRLFALNDDGTISPNSAPHLVLGLLHELPEPAALGAVAVPSKVPARRRSSHLALVAPDMAQLLEEEHIQPLQQQRADPNAKWLLMAVSSCMLHAGDALHTLDLEARTHDRSSAVEALRKYHTQKSLLEAERQKHASIARAAGHIKSLAIARKDKERALRMLLDKCKVVIQSSDTLSHAQIQALPRTIRLYTPDPDDEAEAKNLIGVCDCVDEALAATPADASAAAEPLPRFHPMRGTPLACVLHSHVLTQANAFGSLFKKDAEQPPPHGAAPLDAEAAAAQHVPTPARSFDLSRNVERCSLFLSHSWADNGAQKAALLGFYSQYGALVSRSVVIFSIMALFVFAFGLAFISAFDLETEVMAIALSLVPLSTLALEVIWIVLSVYGCVPSELTPAGLFERHGVEQTVWLDKTCVDQHNVSGFLAAGIDSFELRCDKLIAFVGPSCALHSCGRTTMLASRQSRTRCLCLLRPPTVAVCPSQISNARGASSS
jgi:hypothetical protein